jgi:hypothetical protein
MVVIRSRYASHVSYHVLTAIMLICANLAPVVYSTIKHVSVVVLWEACIIRLPMYATPALITASAVPS